MNMIVKQNPDHVQLKAITQAIQDNDGYCCCALEKNPNTKCMCKDFKEQQRAGFCHCERYYKIPKNKVITLCGSTRFEKEFMAAQRVLTLQGNVVLSVGVFTHSQNGNIDEETKIMLDNLHKQKIDMSDAIFVINVNGYIGESTRSEIEFAQTLGKEIYYLEQTHN